MRHVATSHDLADVAGTACLAPPHHRVPQATASPAQNGLVKYDKQIVAVVRELTQYYPALLEAAGFESGFHQRWIKALKRGKVLAG